MEVTVGTNLLTITLDDGTTQVYPASGMVDVCAERSFQNIYGAATATQVTTTDKYFVRIHLKDNRWLDIDMGTVTNQAGWLNTLVGVNAAVADIDAIFA